MRTPASRTTLSVLSLILIIGCGTPGRDPPPTMTVTAIVAAPTHSLALRADGTVWAWGVNGTGHLGNGSATNRLTPVQLVDLTRPQP